MTRPTLQSEREALVTIAGEWTEETGVLVHCLVQVPPCASDFNLGGVESITQVHELFLGF